MKNDVNEELINYKNGWFIYNYDEEKSPVHRCLVTIPNANNPGIRFNETLTKAMADVQLVFDENNLPICPSCDGSPPEEMQAMIKLMGIELPNRPPFVLPNPPIKMPMVPTPGQMIPYTPNITVDQTTSTSYTVKTHAKR